MKRCPGTKAPKNMRERIDAKPSDWECRHPGCTRKDLSLGRHRCEHHRVFEQIELGLDELVPDPMRVCADDVRRFETSGALPKRWGAEPE